VKVDFRVKFYIFQPNQQQASLKTLNGPNDSENLFLVRDKTKSSFYYTYRLECLREQDLSDFFKYMYQGKLKLSMHNSKSGAKLAKASVNLD